MELCIFSATLAFHEKLAVESRLCYVFLITWCHSLALLFSLLAASLASEEGGGGDRAESRKPDETNFTLFRLFRIENSRSYFLTRRQLRH